MSDISFPAPSAAVGSNNPNIPQLMAGTANACSPAGCDSAPPVAVGLVLRATPQGAPIAAIPAGGKGYLTVALDVDFKGDDLMLFAKAKTTGAFPAVGLPATFDPLGALVVTSWRSNGIRDENLLAETGIPAKAFDITSLRRFGFDTAPTAARQQIVVEIVNTIDPGAGLGDFGIMVGGVVAGTCGDCNTTRRGQ
jgi:hypothetical protein